MIVQDKHLTGRKKRMQHFKDLHGKSGLNIVSLMDIFTILVFFLLVNSSAQQLPSSKDVKLPTTISATVPQESLIIAVTSDSIIVGGRKVAVVNEVLDSAEPLIESLLDELKIQASKSVFSVGQGDIQRAVMIMGDETMPYALLSRILATCQKANYTNISFAAFQTAKGNG